MPLISIKNHSQQTYILQITFDQVDRTSVVEKIKNHWGISEEEYYLTYLDLDGDQITAQIDQDFQVAKFTMEGGDFNNLNFIVHLKDPNRTIVLQEKKQVQKVAEKDDTNQIKEVVLNEEPTQQVPKLEKQIVEAQKQQLMNQSENSSQQQASKQEQTENNSLNLEKNDENMEENEQEEEQAKLKEKTVEKKLTTDPKQLKKQQLLEQKKAIQQKKALENAKKQEARKAAAKKKKQKEEQLKKAKSLKKEKAPLSKEEKREQLRKMIQQEIKSMIPFIKEQLDQLPSAIQNKVQQKKQEDDSNTDGCNLCNCQLSVPFYFVPDTKTLICQKCQKNESETDILIKIKSKEHYSKIAYLHLLSVQHSELVNPNKDNLCHVTTLEEARKNLVTKIQQDYNQQINSQKKRAQAQAQKKKLQVLKKKEDEMKKKKEEEANKKKKKKEEMQKNSSDEEKQQ